MGFNFVIPLFVSAIFVVLVLKFILVLVKASEIPGTVDIGDDVREAWLDYAKERFSEKNVEIHKVEEEDGVSILLNVSIDEGNDLKIAADHMRRDICRFFDTHGLVIKQISVEVVADQDEFVQLKEFWNEVIEDSERIQLYLRPGREIKWKQILSSEIRECESSEFETTDGTD